MPKQIIVEGQTATNPATKVQIVYRGGKWYPAGDPMAQGSSPKNATVSADARVRLAAGLDPAIEAQKNLYKTEEWEGNQLGSNPYNTLRGGMADMLAGDEAGGALSVAAKGIGGQRYQDYTQAAKTFESAFLPILSGASVTASEAQRLIRASLPQMGDTPETLAKKAKNRAMMINGVAELSGRAPPFPRIPSMSFGKGQASPPKPAGVTSGDGWKIIP